MDQGQCSTAFNKFGQPGFGSQSNSSKCMSFDEFVKSKTAKFAIPPKKKTKVEVNAIGVSSISVKFLVKEYSGYKSF